MSFERGSGDADRGQAFTLESVLAAFVVIAGLVFALQAVTVTPSTTGATAEPADTTKLNSVLSESAESGALKRAVLAWDSGFLGTSGENYFEGAYPDNEFGTALDEGLDGTVVVNVFVHYRTGPDTVERQRLIYNGLPGENAVRAETLVTVFDGDHLYEGDGDRRPATVGSAGLYPGLTDQSSTSDVYAVLEVEVIAWQV